MILRPLDDSPDNHYEWSASGIAVIPGLGDTPMSKSGRAETAESLEFTLDATIDPPSATLSVG
jgi:hypothetical protein